MKKSIIQKLILTLFFGQVFFPAEAQPYQHAEYFQASFSPAYSYFNPAFSNNDYRLEITSYFIKEPLLSSDIDSRQFSASYRFKSNWTVGLQASQDNTWNNRLQNLGLLINKRFEITDETYFVFGSKMSLNQLFYSIESSNTRPDLNWEFKDFVVDLGLWFKHKSFFLGCSAKHLLNNTFEITPWTNGTFQQKAYTLHAYAIVGQTTRLTPNSTIETTVRFQHIDRIPVESKWKLRLGYRNMASVGILYGFKEKCFIGFNLFDNGDFTIPLKVVIKKRMSLMASLVPFLFVDSTPFQIGMNFSF